MARLDDQAAHAPEVERHERGDERLEGHDLAVRGHHEVVDDARPQLVGEAVGGDRLRHLLGRDVVAGPTLATEAQPPRGRLGEPSGLSRQLDRGRRMDRSKHRLPGRGERHPPSVELRQQAQRVHVQRDRLHHALEAVGRDLVARVDVEPCLGVAAGHRQDRPDHLPEHRPEVRGRVLRVVDLRAKARLADGEAAGERVGGHPDVDPEPAHLGRPVVLGEVMPHEVARDAEVAADGLADPSTVQRPGQRVGDGVRDRAVVLVAGVQRRHEVEAALEDRPGQELHPLGADRAKVRIDDHERPDVERGRDLEDRAQRRTLAAHAIHLGIRERQALQAVRGPDEQDPLDVVGRLGLRHDALGPVR